MQLATDEHVVALQQRSSISEASLRLHDGSRTSSVCFSTRSSVDVRNVRAQPPPTNVGNLASLSAKA